MTRLPPKSERRKKREAEARPVREGLIERVGRCEYCGRRHHGLEVHEILRGGYRQKTQDEQCATLVLCRPCHNIMGGRDWAEQLAILRRSRPEDFNLIDFHALASRVKPIHEEVDLWEMRLSFVCER